MFSEKYFTHYFWSWKFFFVVRSMPKPLHSNDTYSLGFLVILKVTMLLFLVAESIYCSPCGTAGGIILKGMLNSAYRQIQYLSFDWIPVLRESYAFQLIVFLEKLGMESWWKKFSACLCLTSVAVLLDGASVAGCLRSNDRHDPL